MAYDPGTPNWSLRPGANPLQTLADTAAPAIDPELLAYLKRFRASQGSAKESPDSNVQDNNPASRFADPSYGAMSQAALAQAGLDRMMASDLSLGGMMPFIGSPVTLGNFFSRNEYSEAAKAKNFDRIAGYFGAPTFAQLTPAQRSQALTWIRQRGIGANELNNRAPGGASWGDPALGQTRGAHYYSPGPGEEPSLRGYPLSALWGGNSATVDIPAMPLDIYGDYGYDASGWDIPGDSGYDASGWDIPGDSGYDASGWDIPGDSGYDASGWDGEDGSGGAGYGNDPSGWFGSGGAGYGNDPSGWFGSGGASGGGGQSGGPGAPGDSGYDAFGWDGSVDDEVGFGTDSGDDDDGGVDEGNKIVCSMMNRLYGFGSFRNNIWLHYQKTMQPAKEYELGYHKMFVPLVRRMKSRPLVKALLEYWARQRTVSIRRELRGHPIGIKHWLLRKPLEGVFFVVGKLIKHGYLDKADHTGLSRL